jgi:hypothetical protein
MRMRHSLGGTHGLAVDVVSELAADHAGCRKVDPAPQEPLELMLDPGEAEVADWPVELRDEVEVAVGTRFVASNGAEDEERADAQPPKVVPVGGEELDGISAAHGWIVEPGERVWKPEPARAGLDRLPGGRKGSICSAGWARQ